MPLRRDRIPFLAASISVVIHAILVAILFNRPLPLPAPGSEAPVISMRLLPEIERLPDEDPIPEASTMDRPEIEPDDPPSESRETAESSARTIVTEPPDVVTDELTRPAQPQTAARLRATLLDQLRSQATLSGSEAETETNRSDALPWASSGDSVPGIPGVRGWLSAYVGTVTPSAQTWTDRDGSRRGRYVMADGTVVCTRRRAPTSDELMNPWKSTVVTMGSVCGRERPEGPDLSDPRLSTVPVALRAPPQDGRTRARPQ